MATSKDQNSLVIIRDLELSEHSLDFIYLLSLLVTNKIEYSVFVKEVQHSKLSKDYSKLLNKHFIEA